MIAKILTNEKKRRGQPIHKDVLNPVETIWNE